MSAPNLYSSDYSSVTNLGNLSSYTISIDDSFCLLYNSSVTCDYILPDPNTVNTGFTVCILNQVGTITDGDNTINQTSSNPNRYFKCENSGISDSNEWIVDQQSLSTYTAWATVGSTTNFVGDFMISMQNSGSLESPTGTWLACDGSTFDTILYPNLYTLLGSDTLPLIVDSTIAMSSVTNVAGTNSGSATVPAPLLYHSHEVTDPGHTHSYTAANASGADWNGGYTPYWDNGNSVNGDATGTFSPSGTGVSVQSAGTVDATVSVVQPTFYAKNIYIFAN